jgi:peroxiredoxin Q/BCP
LNTKFARKLELDYPLLSDTSKKTAKEYGVVHEERAVPERWTFYIGKDGKILHVEKKVKAREHGPQVLATLKELGVEEAKKK